MKASLIRSLVVVSAFFTFGFLAITPSQAQSGSSGGGGCCGGSSAPNANTNTATITCGPGTANSNGICVPTTGVQTK